MSSKYLFTALHPSQIPVVPPLSFEDDVKTKLTCHVLVPRHSAHLFVKTADIKTSSSEPKTYVQKGDSGNEMTRAWCDHCGSGIWMRSASKPDMTFLKAGMWSSVGFILSSEARG